MLTNMTGAKDASTRENIEITESEPRVFVRRSKNSKYVIKYYRDLCTGIGTCSLIAGNTFEMDAENKAKLIELPVSEDTDEDILAAAGSCPVLAIHIYDAETGQKIFPIDID